MTCISFGNAIVCVSPWGRLKDGNRYVWVSFHDWCVMDEKKAFGRSIAGTC